MREISTSIEIAASPERVWRVLTDFAAYPEWNPFIRRCAPGIAKRWRVVRGRHGADGRSRRPFSAVKPLWAGGVCRTAGRPRAVQAKPDAARLRRDRGCEGDWEVPSHILRAGARLSIEGGLRKGARLKVRMQLPRGGEHAFSPVVVKAVPAAELRWRGKLLVNGLFDGEHVFLIVPQGRHSVRLIQREQFSGWLAPLVMLGIAGKTRNGFKEMNRALKNVAEAK